MPRLRALPSRSAFVRRWPLGSSELLFADVLKQALEHRRHLRIPQVPVVSARNGMKFVLKMTPFQYLDKFVVRREKALLLPATQKQVGTSARISGEGDKVRIVIASCLAAPGPKDRPVAEPLSNPAQGERAAGHIECRAEAPGKSEKLWMFQRQHDRAKAAHRDSRNCSAFAIRRDRKPAFGVRNQIVHNVVCVAVQRPHG